MRPVWFIFIVALISVLTVTDVSANAPSTSQPAPPDTSLENAVIKRSNGNAATQSGSRTVTKPAGGLDVQRVMLSLAIVLCLILGLRWGGRLLFPGAKAFRPSHAVQVLSRNIISPKQQVLVLQVGRRLVVVGDSGQQMNTLCEISEPNEVASLIGQIRDSNRDPVSKTFSNLFGNASNAYDAPPSQATAESDDETLDAVDRDPREIRDRVEIGLEDPRLSSTREELSGLADKIRLMARQFNKS